MTTNAVAVDINNSQNAFAKTVPNHNYQMNEPRPRSGCPCSVGQLLAIFIPIALVGLFACLFIPIYNHVHNDDDEKVKVIVNNQTNYFDLYDEFEENVTNITYATLTPKDGYDNILFFLGGISDVSNKYFDFFKSKNTFVPKGTKIYFLSGQPRQMQFMVYYYEITDPVPGWFNVDHLANLVPPNDYTQAKESLNIVLDEIDRVKAEENTDYKNIYLSGFSQGAVMTNYVLLNSRYKLGGYIAFSGYVFDHEFPANYLADFPLSDVRQNKLDSRKDYPIIATHSFHDNAVFYSLSSLSYYSYYENYTDFKFLSFGNLLHVLPEQPIHPTVKKWIIEKMGK